MTDSSNFNKENQEQLQNSQPPLFSFDYVSDDLNDDAYGADYAFNDAGLDKIAADLGVMPPLVCTDPAGLQFKRKKTQLKGFVKKLLNALNNVKINVSDYQLVDSHIQAANDKLADIEHKQAKSHESPTPKIATVQQAEILNQASASLNSVAISNNTPAKLTTSERYTLAKTPQEIKNANSDASSTRYSKVHSRLSDSQWLFPDYAGDRKSPQANKGNSVRARRSSRKKRLDTQGRKAQGSLFAGI